jgi:hypothetical protein
MSFAICPRCDGAGTHTNPAIDGNGITTSEMDELGEDFREDYLAGVYDIRCERCRGDRVVLACSICQTPAAEGVNDEGERFELCVDHLGPRELESYLEEARYRAEVEAERRMGA